MEEFFTQFWNLFATFIWPPNLRHPEKYTEALQMAGAIWPSLVAVSAIVFAETGLLIGFLLPGDSMLVVVGIFIRAAGWSLILFMVVLTICAIVGDTVGYWFGAKAGPKLFKKQDSRFFKQEYLKQAHDFYERHGGKAIIIARFIPIVRTFVPMVAGAVRMNYRTFLFYNVIGGIGWIVSMLLLGYMLDPALRQLIGPQFNIAKHIDKVILVVVFLSIAPMIYKVWAANRAGKTPKEAVAATVAGIDPEPEAPKAGTIPAESPKP
jgi:membrane-associated protein